MKPWIKRSLFGVFALFGAAVIAGGVTACGHRQHGDDFAQWSAEDAARWRERVVDRASDKLALDAAQQQNLGALFDTLREQRNALVGSTPKPRGEMLALISGDKFDSARAQALIDEKTNAIRAGSPQTIAAMATFYDSLNAEQQGKLREWLGKRHHGWRS